MDNSRAIAAPTLLLTYNRPELARGTLKKIIASNPSKIYIASDGPKDSDPKDEESVMLCRKYLLELVQDFQHEVLFQPQNLGVKAGVIQAIDWFFSNEERGIILEDDCDPSRDFFRFATELLETYRNDSRIGQIAGNSYFDFRQEQTSSYFFARHPHIWGWATWSRNWASFKDFIASDDRENEATILSYLTSVGMSPRNSERLLVDLRAGYVDSWAYWWMFHVGTQNQLTIFPRSNLIQNIGFSEDATHTKRPSFFADIHPETEDLEEELIHPKFVFPDAAADTYSFSIFLNLNGNLVRSMARLAKLAFGFRPRLFKRLFLRCKQ